MSSAAHHSEPGQALQFVATELVREQHHLSVIEAVNRAVTELRRRGIDPSSNDISAARRIALDAHTARLAELNKAAKLEDARAEASAPQRIRLASKDGQSLPITAARTDARYHPETGALDLRPRLAWVDFDPNAESRPPSWLVKGIFPRQGVALIVGESGAGKTFLAIHAALAIAWGVPFFGRRTRPGAVLYIAAEGGSSVLPRLRAADASLRPAVSAARLGGQEVNCNAIRVVTEAPNLSRDGSPTALTATIEDAAIEFAQAGVRLSLVVIDTWHAALGGGDENSAADAGAALAPLRAAAEAHGALVLIVHHSGKDAERGARGSSALPAAADAIIALTVPGHSGPVAKPSEAPRSGVVTKVRDGEAGEQLKYRLPIVLLGEDEDGDPWTTCVVEPFFSQATDDEGLSKDDRKFLDAVDAALSESTSGQVSVQEVRARFYAQRAGSKPDANRKAFRRALDEAATANRISIDEAETRIWRGE